MQIKNLIADEDAVSPVIGVILMVAITVILAAVIGTFVLGLGDQVQDNAPQASFTFDYDTGDTTTDECTAGVFTGGGGDNGALEITHDGGDKIDGTKLDITDGSATEEWTGDCSGATDVTAGNSVTAQVDSVDTIRVIWQSGGQNSATIGKWTGPDA